MGMGVSVVWVSGAGEEAWWLLWVKPMDLEEITGGVLRLGLGLGFWFCNQ